MVNNYSPLLALLIFVSGLAHGQDFKAIIKHPKDDSTVVAAYTGLMKSFDAKAIDSVRFYGKEALAYSQRKKYYKGECLVNLNMGNVMLFHSGFAEAERYCKEGIRIAEKYGFQEDLARGYNLITVVYGKKGDYVKATDFALKSLRVNEELDDKRGIIASYMKLSAISVDLKKYDKAITYANIADSINHKTLKRKELEIGIVNNKAIAYAELKQLDKALAMFNRIYEIAQNNPEIDDFQKPSALLNIGMVYKSKKDYHQAMSYFKKSLDESLKYNVPDIELKSIQNIATIYYDLGDHQNSLKNALLALEKSRSISSEVGEMSQLKLITDNYTQLGEYKKALSFTTEYYEKLNTYNESKNEKDIQELESLYQLEKTEEKLQIANEMNETRTRQRDLSIVFSVFVFGFMLVFALAYHRIRQLNKQNMETKNQLSESNQVKDKLFSIIGHDLRSTYSGTLGLLQMIKEKKLNEKDMELWINQAISQSYSAIETLDNLLMWGYAQIKGGGQLNPVAIRAYELVNKNIEFLSGNIREKNISVYNHVPDDLVLTADYNHFLFIIRNLISNAIKFTPVNGAITIGHTENGLNEFYVKDNGVGISEDRLIKLFAFSGNSTEGTNEEKGTGLGLLLCKEFVELNGGEIRVESELGEGTTFYFSMNKKNV
ncbi:tetratricopeptide repeat-containing sensor histidine kinase [Pseudopedobacter beijingensis]|uniref:histidine kinase n=1 Tax=Pseudopedobacter beijingensis TaxID=1207056 RepID=A0ABW4IB17_9SPHI